MNTQNLKEQKNEIISRIREIADESKMKEIMTAMLNIVNGGMNSSDNPIDLVDEVVELFGYQKIEESKNTLWGPGCKYSTQSEYQRACLGQKFSR